MTGWDLPTELEVAGQRFAVRSDFRAVLDALAALNDTALPEQARCLAFLQIFYPDWQHLPDANEALRQAMVFVNLGQPVQQNQPHRPELVHWNTDVQLIAPAVDKVLGYSCRRCEYLHWWDFIGAFQNIGEGLFASVVNIRNKRARGKKLDKAEKEFARENADLIGNTASRFTAEEEAFFKRLGLA